MRRLSELTLTILLITVCSTFSGTAEWKSKGGEGNKNKQIYGYVYISENPYSIWYADDTHAYTMTDHGFRTWNFSERGASYDYEFKQYLAEYDIVRKQAGVAINEAKELGWGSIVAFDPEIHNCHDSMEYQANKFSFQYHFLPEFNLTEGNWYEVGGYTRLSIVGRRGGDSWQVDTAEMHFQWWEADN